MKILGREPALIVGVVNAAIMFAGTLGFPFLSDVQAGALVLVVNAISAVIVAWATRPLSPAVFSYAVSTLISLGVAYGFTLTDAQIAGINGLIVPMLALLTRGQVSPVETKVTNSSNDPTVEAARKDGLPVKPTA